MFCSKSASTKTNTIHIQCTNFKKYKIIIIQTDSLKNSEVYATSALHMR